MHRTNDTPGFELHGIDGKDGVFDGELRALAARRAAVRRRPDPEAGGHRPDPGSAAACRCGARTTPGPDPDAVETARRAQAKAHGGLDAPGSDVALPFPAPGFGLAGLAISGGGIRSATFNLGVLQVFAKRGLLRWFDYLSTVSGGGYIGSALTSTLKFEIERQPDAPLGASFVHTMGEDEPPLIKRLRSGGNYLAPGGLRDLIRIPAVLLRGMFVNLMVVAPLVGLLAVMSALMPPFGVFFYQFEFTGFSAEQLGRGDVLLDNAWLFFSPTLLFAVLFLLWSALFPLIAKLSPHSSWGERNRFELSFSTLLLAIGGVGLLNTLPFIYLVVFDGADDAAPWRVAVAGIVAALPVATSLNRAAARAASFNAMADRLKLWAAALLGPLILLSIYLGLTHLVLTPITFPFGADSSALNVAVRALEHELVLDTNEIMADESGRYPRWVKELYERGPARPPASDPFHAFLWAFLEHESNDLAPSLEAFRRQFRPALAVRTHPLGVAVFGDNRFVPLLGHDLTGSTVTLADLDLADTDGSPEALLRLRFASEELRKDLVVIHSMILLAIMVAVILYVKLFVDINKTGLHSFYRDRLSKAYLWDPGDPKGTAGRADGLKLSELEPDKTGAPYHLVNATLNIPGTDNIDLQGRASDFYAMSPLWCGSPSTGYYRTTQFEDRWDPDLTLATAFAVSGAAAAPQMGAGTNKALSLVMTLLNIRLDYWMPNPVSFRRAAGPRGGAGPFYLLREISGHMGTGTQYVNLSDGGHIENLGLYELLRRRCKYIVVCDAEQDPGMILSSLGKVTAYARMDDGVWIDWQGTLERFKKNPATGFSGGHWAIGTIHYGEEEGRILYVKASMCGKEWPDMMTYRARHPDFPQQSTGEQFFNEEQFEAYRALGYMIASKLFPDESWQLPCIDCWFADLAAMSAQGYGGYDEIPPPSRPGHPGGKGA